MPLSLPPLSRRGFLRGSLAAGLAALLPSLSRGEEKTVDPNRIALLSDTHVAADRAFVAKNKVGEVNVFDHLQQACREVLALDTTPGRFIVNGDVAYKDGQPGDYETFLAGVEPMRKAGMSGHLLMGNHDDRQAFFKAVPGDELRQKDDQIADRQVLIVPTPHANLFMLDSLEKTNKTPGLLGEKQLAWLAKSLDARADKPAVIFIHHDPDPTKPTGLTDLPAFYEVIMKRKQVKAYIYGHTHTWVHKKVEGVHHLNLPPVAYVFGAERPIGWVDLKLADTSATVELRCLDPKHPKHGEKIEMNWR